MTVNVYTYYANKLALEEAASHRERNPVVRRKRSRKSKGFSVPRMVQIGLATGLATGSAATLVLCPAAPPYLLVAGTLWGWLMGWMLDRIRFRTGKFMAALKGRPLGNDDLRDLLRGR